MSAAHLDKLRDLFLGEHRSLLDAAAEVIVPDAGVIADRFYDTLLALDETHAFLDNELVDRRLRPSMAGWLTELFAPRSDEDVAAFVARQRLVGNVHARVNIPMHLVNYGMRVIKREFYRRLVVAEADRERLADMLWLTNDLLDQSAELINESYLKDLVENERNAVSLRMNAVSQNLAIECERVRADLFDWLRRVLTLCYQSGGGESCSLQPLVVRSSDFGLWVVHKAELLFPNSEEIARLKEQIERLDRQLRAVLELRGGDDRGRLNVAVAELNEMVTHAAWLLSALVEHTLEMDSGRDPLTRLFSRRYLPTILQRETAFSVRQGARYAVLLCDVDHFKRINDQWGHGGGDRVLRQFAELLAAAVRASDFVFRYGGEEFLVLLSDVDPGRGMEVAEKLRRKVAEHRFVVGDNDEIPVTASIGVAVHDGHPDYHKTLERADAALYEAKREGRNRCVLGTV